LLANDAPTMVEVPEMIEDELNTVVVEETNLREGIVEVVIDMTIVEGTLEEEGVVLEVDFLMVEMVEITMIVEVIMMTDLDDTIVENGGIASLHPIGSQDPVADLAHDLRLEVAIAQVEARHSPIVELALIVVLAIATTSTKVAVLEV
jgi:hypothetical protein